MECTVKKKEERVLYTYTSTQYCLNSKKRKYTKKIFTRYLYTKNIHIIRHSLEDEWYKEKKNLKLQKI